MTYLGSKYRRDHWKRKQVQAVDPADVLPMDTTPTPCYAPVRQGDEYICLKCRMRWDTHEERPPCPNGE